MYMKNLTFSPCQQSIGIPNTVETKSSVSIDNRLNDMKFEIYEKSLVRYLFDLFSFETRDEAKRELHKLFFLNGSIDDDSCGILRSKLSGTINNDKVIFWYLSEEDNELLQSYCNIRKPSLTNSFFCLVSDQKFGTNVSCSNYTPFYCQMGNQGTVM